ncbi:chaplin [Streptomyces sp. M19]
MKRLSKAAALTVVTGAAVLGAAGGAVAHDGASARAGRRFPGVISGNTIQVPVHIPVNLCGNSIDVIGLFNPSMGNHCVNK